MEVSRKIIAGILNNFHSVAMFYSSDISTAVLMTKSMLRLLLPLWAKNTQEDVFRQLILYDCGIVLLFFLIFRMRKKLCSLENALNILFLLFFIFFGK